MGAPAVGGKEVEGLELVQGLGRATVSRSPMGMLKAGGLGCERWATSYLCALHEDMAADQIWG